MSELRIPYPTERAGKRGLDLQKWGVLINTTFPAAQTEDAIINAWDCQRRQVLVAFVVEGAEREGGLGHRLLYPLTLKGHLSRRKIGYNG